MTDAIIAATAGERIFLHPPNPHEGFERRICESHYALCEGVSNIMVHPDVQGYCPRCKAVGIAWYLDTTCADEGSPLHPTSFKAGRGRINSCTKSSGDRGKTFSISSQKYNVRKGWLELKRDGNTTSKTAKSRAPSMGK
jgi:hypothetical protein